MLKEGFGKFGSDLSTKQPELEGTGFAGLLRLITRRDWLALGGVELETDFGFE